MTQYRYASPRELRKALETVQWNWNSILTEDELNIPLDPTQWDGQSTLRNWLAGGAYTETGASYASRLVFGILQQHK